MSLIGKSIGNYQITAKLGEGGMGAVYLGEHPLIGKRVAVKVLLEELSSNQQIVERFFNEAKAVNDIGHQNIVDIVDFGKMKSDVGTDIVYFVMEYLDGESLASRIKRGGLSQQETLHVISQACAGLSASHAKGIVHRDLKPDNIYLCPRGNDKNFVKILDFGIAKLTGDGGQSHKTRTGLVIGTPTYMSPEQCEGKGHIDHRSDIYSLGVLMYELLTGRVPFPGDGFGEILVAHLMKIPENPSVLNPDVTPELEAIVLHAIEKDRNRRFQTMAEFQQAVENVNAHFAEYRQLPGYAGGNVGSASRGTMVMQQDQQVTMRGPSQVMQAARGPMTQAGTRVTTLSGASGEVTNIQGGRRSRAPLFASAFLLLAGLGGAGWYFTQGNKPTTTTVAAAVEAPAPAATTPAPAAPQKEETVVITVTTQPSGAHVLRADKGGEDVGVTPLELKLKKGEPAFDVQLRLDGYRVQTRPIRTDASKEILVELAKNEPAQPLAPKPAPAVAKPAAPAVARPAAAAKPHTSKPHAGKKPAGDTDDVMIPNF